MRVLLTGGGTGGHIYPALAIANHIKKEYLEAEVLYVGTNKGLEARIVSQTGIPFKEIDVEGLQRRISLRSIRTGCKAFSGVIDALKIIKEFNPQIVIGTGGYVCGPVVLAAKILNVPTMIHEQNALPGITNKILGKFADRILISFPQSEKHFSNKKKVILTGVPIRAEILCANKEDSYRFFDLDPKKKTVLITGGSRGARKINTAMTQAYAKLSKEQDVQFLHIAGQLGYDEMAEELLKIGINIEIYGNIILKAYLDHMEYALAVSDMYIARAGATFLAEVTAKGLPGILIPYPYAAENHQEFNAEALVEQGAARMILDKDLNGETIYQEIIEIIHNPENLLKMKNNSKKAGNTQSLAKIMKAIEELLEERQR